MDMQRNLFKRALAAREPQIGLFLGMAEPYVADLVADTGFDWLLIDGEHGPNDLRTIIAQLQVLAAHPVRPVVRTRDHDPAAIKQLLDAGAQTLMVPMVETADQARALIRAMRYPPHGIRGVGTAMARAARWNGVADYFTHADDEQCLIVQIESRAALDGLAGILEVDGVDAVFVGPSDLAASLGHLGNPGHPEVRDAAARAIGQIAAAGKAAGVFSADPALAASYRDIGASFVLVGVDALLLRNAAVSLAARFKEHGAAAGAAY
jgi:4-hydroxy-2-oxoheptanedioate aldolase